MKKGISAALLLILAFSCSIALSFSNTIQTQSGTLPDFSGRGGPINIAEYAVGDFGAQNISATTSWSAMPDTVITPGYNAVKITLTFSTGYDVRNWTVNENFTIPSPANWSTCELNNEVGQDVVNFTMTYEGTYDDCVEVSGKGGGQGEPDAIGDYGGWRQIVDITSADIAAAEIILNYSRDYQSQNPNNARLFVDVNGQRLEIARFDDPNDSPTPLWHIFEADLDAEQLNESLPGLLNVSLGVEYRGGKLAQQVTAYYSYVSLVITVPAVSSQYDVRIRDAAQPTENTSIPESGIVTLEGNWVDQIDLEIWSNSSVSVGFTTSVDAVSNKTVIFDFQTVPDNNVNWSGVFEAIHPYYPYDYKHFNISVPLDWNISSVLDPILKEQLGKNASIFTFPSQKILFVDAEHAGRDLGLTEALFGDWQIFADSPNYALDCFTQAQSDAGWANTSTIHLNEILRTTLVINSSVLALNAGRAFLTIYDPDLTVFAQQTIIPNASGIIDFDDISFDLTISKAGNYTIDLGWAGNDEAGNIRSQFLLIRPASFELLHPTDSEASVYVDSSFMISVQLMDNYTAEAVTDMQVFCHFSWENETSWHLMDISGDRYVTTVYLPPAVLPGPYSIHLSTENQSVSYEAKSISLEIDIKALPTSGILGLDLITLPVAIGAVAGAGGYILWNQFLKYPAMVRKIRKLRAKIRKGKTATEPVEVKSRQDLARDLQVAPWKPTGDITAMETETTPEMTIEQTVPAEKTPKKNYQKKKGKGTGRSKRKQQKKRGKGTKSK